MIAVALYFHFTFFLGGRVKAWLLNDGYKQVDTLL